MKIKEIANLFKERTNPIIIICDQKDINAIISDLKENTKDMVEAENYGAFNNENTIASKLGISSAMIDGKTIHLVPEDKKMEFFKVMAQHS